LKKSVNLFPECFGYTNFAVTGLFRREMINLQPGDRSLKTGVINRNMEKIVIQEPLKNVPGIVYDPGRKTLEVTGRSIPENPESIFRRLDEWITGYFDSEGKLTVIIFLEYINSGSSKYLYEILRKLTGYKHSGREVRIIWKYEEDDEAMLDLGEHYRDSAGIPLEIEMIL